MAILLVAVLTVQLLSSRYVPWIYWLTVVLVSVIGTQITDALTDGLDVSLYVSTTVFAVMLMVTFAAWYAREQTLSIHTIITRRRELFYWDRDPVHVCARHGGGETWRQKLSAWALTSAFCCSAP